MPVKSEGPHHGPTRVMASAPSVVQQARLMDDAGSAWHAVKCGNLEMITKLFPTQCNVYTKGPVGENVMHVAMLLNTPSTLAITRYLVKLYGTVLVNCPIQERKQAHDPPGTYEGQTALHIAIVNRDFDMVKFLVQHGANIRARAWGTFFKPDGPMYYGEYPLSFAACTGQKDVVAYLKRHGAQVNRDCDEHGNTALHMCVYHNQPDMYDFLVEYCAASDTVRNHGGLTPLVLAAHLGKQDILQHIYSRRRRAFYSFGKVTSYSLALREIDTVQDEDTGLPDGGYTPNVLEVVLRKRHLEMLSEPLLTTLLAHKWEAFARTQFLLHFVGYLLLEVSQTILIWLHSDPLYWNGPARASQEILGVILALLMLLVEILDYSNWSREAYHRRLTMTLHKDEDPPLYPIPGEVANLRDGRQSLFARLSARMGFSGHSQSSHPSLGSLSHHNRSDSNFSASNTPRKTHQPTSASSGPSADVPQSATAVAGGSNVKSNAVTGLNSRESGRPSGMVSTTSPGQPSSLRPQQQEQLPQKVSNSFGSVISVAVPQDAAAGSPFATGLQHAGSMSPTRSNQQMLLQTSKRSHDDPLNLEPGFGGHVVGEGTPSRGVAVVDSGYTAATAAAAAAAAAQQGSDGGSGSAQKLHLGPGPVGEALEDQQQQGPTAGSAAATAADAPAAAAAAAGVMRQQLSSGGEGSRHGGNAYLSAAHDDEEPSDDVVSVGLRSNRIRSHHALSEVLGGSGNLMAANAADAGSAPLASGRSVTFSQNIMSRTASGRVSGVNPLGQMLQGSPSNVTPLLQPQSSQASSQLSTDGSANAGAAAGSDAAGPPAAGGGLPYVRHRSSTSSPLRMTNSSADGSAAGSAAAAGSSALAVPSASSRMVVRAKSFHGTGVSTGYAGVSEQTVALAASGRASTGYSELDLLNSVSSTSPADPVGAVQMLERQRTRARSGGGDLPASLALKRTQVAKKETSNLGPAGSAAAAGGGGGGGGDGGDGSARGSSVAMSAAGGGDQMDSAVNKGDLEKGSVAYDPHKSRLRALLETTYEGFMRMLDDPWLFIWHLHLLLTCLHFLIWISSYGWIGGSGPSSLQVRALDDIVVSMMGLSGWLAVIYFFRGFAPTGKLTVVLERCILDVVKFVSLYVLWNLGFSLAFFTIQNGILAVSPTPIVRETLGIGELGTGGPDPFDSIGYSMITLINLGTGLSHYEYSMTCQNGYVLSSALCTVYYMLYMATVVLLLLNLLIAMILTTYSTTQSAAEASWRHRWATYVVKAERRLPLAWVQRLRLGQQAWDPVSRRPVYSHVFETVDEDKAAEAYKQGIEGQIKGLETLLEDLKKRKGGGS